MNFKAWDLFRLGKYKESLGFINQSIEINSSNGSAWDTKGAALMGLRKYEEAIECLDRALLVNLDESEKGWVWLRKAHALKSLGRIAEANEAYMEAEKLGRKEGDFRLPS